MKATDIIERVRDSYRIVSALNVSKTLIQFECAQEVATEVAQIVIAERGFIDFHNETLQVNSPRHGVIKIENGKIEVEMIYFKGC